MSDASTEASLTPAEKVKQFPTTPGVYLMKDAQGRVTNKLVGTVFTDHSDPFAASCVMP